MSRISLLHSNPRIAAESPAKPVPSSGDLLDILGEFDRILLLRAQSATAANEALAEAIRKSLTREADRFGSGGKSIPSGGPAELVPTRLRTLLVAGNELANASDARRAAFAAHWNHFDEADNLVKSALDQNWTLFGRVIARQSLISLSRQLDDVRRRTARLTAANANDPGTVRALTESEANFSETLRQNTAGLTRSQGARWVQQLRGDLSAMISNLAEFGAADRRATVALNTFEQVARSVETFVRTATEPSGSAVAAATSAVSAETAITPPSLGTITTASTAEPFLNEHPNVQKQPVHLSIFGHAFIAAVCGVALLVLLIVSITTVRSVVIPVRQFMTTSARLSMGDAAARFQRGGIREIDSLALSLNEMASTLEAAQSITREYQGALELRIEERTQRLKHLALHDLLTALPNRRLLMKHLKETFRLAPETGGMIAVYFVDVDNFKNVNDSRGHTFGDQLLRAIARRLKLLTASHGFLARLGGDDFAIVRTNTQSIEQATEWGTTLVQAFQSPILVEGVELLITISAGISSFPEHGTTMEAMVSAADAALFNAKNTGRNRLSLFDRRLLETVSKRFDTEQSLRRALERNEFELVYQPEIDFAAGGIKLVEALLRWRLPDGRRISPMQFLPTAEEAGLTTSIGDWVLRSAIESAADWHHGSWPDVRVAVNVSASQLLDTGFARRVQQLLLQYDLPPQCIEIELTEAALQTGPTTLDTLRELRTLDIAVALDDFGTGFSTLASLQHPPLSRVKLDQSLIATINQDERALAIANSIIALCGKLGLEVTAEGIERPGQLGLLLKHHSICLQGYLISLPMERTSVAAAVRSMPEHMQSLFLTSQEASTMATHAKETPAEDELLLFQLDDIKG